MYKYTIAIIVLYSLAINADIDMQKGMYDSAEEMIRFDEKMNQAIAKHNQWNRADEDEMRLNSMVEDFEETDNGYILKRNIDDSNHTKIDIKVENGVLHITTNTTEQKIISDVNISGSETILSSSSMSLSIPNDADENSMEKSYENGVLKIKFSKKQ
ncbi:MAG: Hsp20/alpha crystallin family protein [Sulfurovaceae bacterium]|nr:Hsp20/alpha crystallin family protein [Sulfurovaceae bacterium]